MVRLNPVDPELAGSDDGNSHGNNAEGGAHAQVVDDLLSDYRTKNPKSSLDYKPPDGANGEQVIPPPMMKADEKGNNVIELDYSQFAGMSHEEIVQKIQGDPEIARQFADAHGAGNGMPPTSKKNPRLEQLGIQEGKFPITQWIILLLLLGYGTWRVYLNKQQGASKKAAVTPRTTSLKSKNSSKGKQTKTKASTGAKINATASKQQPLSTNSKKPAKPQSDGVVSTVNKKKKPKTKPTVQFKETSRAESDSSDDEDITKIAARSRKKPSNKRDMAVTQNTSSKESSEDGWQKVGANGSSSSKGAKNNGASANATAENEIKPEPALVADPAVANVDALSDDGFLPSKTSKKKKKKKANSDDVADSPALANSPNTEADAALAARLQEAENNLEVANEEDEWAQVKKPRKKDKNKENEVSAQTSS